MIPRAKIRISEYSYGRITKKLKNAINWVNSNNSKINNFELEFCLPKSIYNCLSSDEFDFLEEQTYDRREYFWNKDE